MKITQFYPAFGCWAVVLTTAGCGADAESRQEGQTIDAAGPELKWTLERVTIDSSDSAGIQIPERFQGVWVFDAEFCANPADEPGTFINAEGFRREELWGEAQEIRSISPDGTEMHLIMGYQFETMDMTLYDSRWTLSESDTRLEIVETNLWEGADPHESPSDNFVRCPNEN